MVIASSSGSTRAAIPHLKRSGWGRIVNISGLNARRAGNLSGGARNGSLVHFTRTLALQLGQHGITVNCICPGRVHTPFVDGFIAKHNPGNEAAALRLAGAYQPMGRMAKPEEIAPLVLFLLSDASSFVTGSAYTIDGGVTSCMAANVETMSRLKGYVPSKL